MTGIKMYSVPADITGTISRMKSLSIDTVFLGGEAGLSKILIEEFKESGIDLYLVFPVFYDPEFLQNHEECFSITRSGEKASIDWVRFVCPSREDFLESKCEKIKQLILDYKPSGISLDFLRFFVFWEKIDPHADYDDISHGCFDSCCTDSFGKEVSLPVILKTPREKSEWILGNRREEWMKWKTDLITGTAQRLISTARETDPDISTGVHLLPWRITDFENGMKTIAGQDVARLSGIADFISPMCYAPMCKRDSGWINEVVSDHDRLADCPVISSIQVEKAYDEEPVSPERFEADLTAALKVPSSGVLLWSWEALLKSELKQNILKMKL